MLNEGDVFNLEEGDCVYAEVPKHFLYANKKGVWDLGKGEIEVAGEFSYLIGRCVVVSTSVDGGGHTYDGGWPNGHHVFAEHIESGQRFDFYQSGCFTCMIREREAIGKATKKYVIEQE
jgi:hypothetical protein